MLKKLEFEESYEQRKWQNVKRLKDWFGVCALNFYDKFILMAMAFFCLIIKITKHCWASHRAPDPDNISIH